MAFTPRTYDEILEDLLAYIEENTKITDTNEGSVILTILEALATEADEQYFQMTQILQAFSIFKARGANLDRRVADFGISRKVAKPAITKVRYYDTTVAVGKVSVNAAAGATTLAVFDSTIFPTTGFPYLVRLAENTPLSQQVTVSANNLVGSSLTVSPLIYATTVGTNVNLVQGTVARVINSGVQIQIPASLAEEAKTFVTTEQAYISPGNTYSNEVYAKALVTGTNSNGPVGAIRAFASSPPFQGASIQNTTEIRGGFDIEDDESLQRRAVEQIFGRSAATKLALKAAAKGVIDATTGRQVKSASVVEDFIADEVRVYIDDGTGFTPDAVSFPIGTTASVSSGVSSVVLNTGIDTFPDSGAVLIISNSNSELLNYIGKTATALNLTSNTAFSHASGSAIYLVEPITLSSELNQTLFKLKKVPVTRDSEVVYYKTSTGSWTQLPRTSGYVLNRSTGDMQLLTALQQYSQIVVSYTYNINLAAEVTKVLEGDPNDEVNYPGVKSAGVRISIESPILRRLSVTILITAKQGFDEGDLRTQVRQAVETYISSLDIGQDVVVSRITKAAQEIDGVESAKVLDPSDDVVILERELASCFSSAGDSYVSVT